MNDRQVAMITGAARGIGRATAVEFAGRGFDVALLDVLPDELCLVAEQIAAMGGTAITHAVDLSDLELAQRCIRDTADRFGRIDVLVNNAAWRELKNMREITVESWERTIRVCLTAPAFLARWVAEFMEPRGHGVIVNVSSIMAERGGAMAPAYVAAKGGLDSLTYDLAALYGGSGIRVFSINPGAIDTELSNDYADAEGQSLKTSLRAWSEDAVPLGRWGRADEIARVIVALAGDDASYLTGTNVAVDGGWSHAHFPHSLLRKMGAEQ